MKANRNFGILKAIAFITAVFFFVACCQDEIPTTLTKATVTIKSAENITATTATIVALVIPNQDNTAISFSYAGANTDWLTIALPGKFQGSDSIKVTLDLSDLRPNTRYTFKVTAANVAGAVTSEITSFFTLPAPVLVRPVITVSSAEFQISTAKLIAAVIPNQSNTTVSFLYQNADSVWQTKVLGTNYSGTTAINLTMDLTDLQPNTKYNFRVKAVNNAGEVFSAVSSFTTYAVKDYDGNFYHIVTIGTQTWLKENLKTTHFLNGDAIANITDQTAWTGQTTSAYCYYDNNPEYGKDYGCLYNWYVASDARVLIEGYHTPSSTEFLTLMNYLGGTNAAGGKLKETGFVHWLSPNRGADNSSGFTAVGSGQRVAYGFLGFKGTSCFLSKSILMGYSCEYSLNCGNVDFASGGNYFYSGAAIRLVKN